MNKTLILVALIISISILGFGYMNYKSKENAIIEQRNEEGRKIISYFNCVDDANHDYNSYWDAQCSSQGVNQKTAGCSLPKLIADGIEARREKAIKNCVDLYK